MADNQILISAQFDVAELDKQMKSFAAKFRNALNASLKNLKIDLSKISGLKTLTIPVKVDLTQAKKDIDEFRKQLAANPLNLTTTASPPTTRAKNAPVKAGTPALPLGQLSNLLVDQSSIDATVTKLTGLREVLKSTGFVQKEVTKHTREFETELKEVQKAFDAIVRQQTIRGRNLQGPTQSGGTLAGGLAPPTNQELNKFQDLKLRLDKVTGAISSYDIAGNKAAVQTERLTHFMESFGFKVGIVGFGLSILGGNLSKLSQSMFQFAQNSAKVTEPLERVTNLLTQMQQSGALTRGEGDFLFSEINRIADLPGGNLERIVKSFRALANLNLGMRESLELIEGLTKATALAGTGAEGVERLVEQFRQFTQSGVITERDIRTISEQGGVKVTEALQGAFGTTSAKKLQEAGPAAVIEAITKGLKQVETPLRTTSDLLNIINNSWVRMQANINQIIQPGLVLFGELVKQIELSVQGIAKAFASLSPTTQKFVSALVVAVPIIASGLGAILTSLGGIALSVATLKQLGDLFAVFSGSIAATGGGVAGAFSGIAQAISKIVSFAGPIGIIITLVTAFITDWFQFRTSIVEGVSDMISGLTKLINKLAEFRAIRGTFAFIVGFLEGIFNVVGSLIGLVGDLVEFLFTAIGNLAVFFSDLLDVFNATSLRDALNRLVAAVVANVVRMAQAGVKVVVSLFKNLVETGLKFLDTIGAVNAEQSKSLLKSIDDFNTKFSESNVIVKDGKIIMEEYKETQVEAAKETDNLTKQVKLQAEAFRVLASAAEEAEDKLKKRTASAADAAIGAEITELRNTISTAVNDYKESLRTAFDPADIDQRAQKLLAVIAEKRDKITALLASQRNLQAPKLVSQIPDELVEGAFKAAANLNDFFRQRFPEVFTLLRQGTASVKAATTPATVSSGLDDIQKALELTEKQRLAMGNLFPGLSSENVKALETLLKFGRDVLKQHNEETKKENSNLEKFIIESNRSIRTATKARRDELDAQAAQLQMKVDQSTIDGQITAKNAEIEENVSKIQKFLLTTSEARKRNLEISLQIAELEKKRDIASLQKERDIASGLGDTGKVADIDFQIAQRTAEALSKAKEIRKKFEGEQAQDDRETAEKRKQRFAKLGEDIVKIIKPFEEQLLRAFSLGILDPKSQRTKDIFVTLGGEFQKLGEFSEPLNALRKTMGEFISGGATIDDVIRRLLTVKDIEPLQRDLNNNIDDIKNLIQANLLSLIDPEELKTGITRTGPLGAVFSALGIDVGDSADQIITKIKGTEDFNKLRQVFEGLFALIPQAEQETLTQAFNLNDSIRTQLTEIDINGFRELFQRILQQISTTQTEIIDGKIKEIQSKIAQSEKAAGDNRRNNQVAVQNELNRDLVRYETEKAETQAYYRALEEANATKDVDRKKQIETDLQNELLRIRAEGARKLQELGDQEGKLLPSPTPVPVLGDKAGIKTPAPKDTKAPRSGSIFKDLIDNVKGLDTKTVAEGIMSINEALQETVKAGLAASQAMHEFLDTLANGDLVIATFHDVLSDNANMMDFFGSVAVSVAGAIGNAFVGALKQAIESGENFFAAFARLLGQHLINMGLALLAELAAAYIFATLEGILWHDWSMLGKVIALTPAVLAASGALIGLGALLGGTGAGQAASTNTQNAANANAGARGEDFDADRDPRSVFQKALMAQIQIDIKTDEGQIVKTVIKHVNQNGRLTKLIGNRKLAFTM